MNSSTIAWLLHPLKDNLPTGFNQINAAPYSVGGFFFKTLLFSGKIRLTVAKRTFRRSRYTDVKRGHLLFTTRVNCRFSKRKVPRRIFDKTQDDEAGECTVLQNHELKALYDRPEDLELSNHGD